jgi:septal ring factor EnvC (AmiA/AmiB activator)
MDKIDETSVNSLSQLTGDQAEPASEKDLLQSILAELRELRDENAAFKEKIAAQEEEIARVKEEMRELSSAQAAFARKTNARLDGEKEPWPKQRNQAEVLEGLLRSPKNDGKMLEKTARELMGLSKSQFSDLLKTMQDRIQVKPYYADRRKHLLVFIGGNE